jgi:uncharacterized protein
MRATARKAGNQKADLLAPAGPARVSGRWLLLAVAATLAAAAFCAWGALCLLFWQGSWQLLYHPAATVARSPASVGLAFEPVAFAATDEGEPRLRGWWIPAAADAPFNRFTLLLLHGQDGNVGDTPRILSRLHAIGANVLVFDYRAYGQSQFTRPSEANWRQDTEWALTYLTATRHISPGSIVLDGQGLGANLALEVAAAHPELAGVILESPVASPMNAVFDDARARLVPARLLVRDRYDLNAAAEKLRIPALWFEWNAPDGRTGFDDEPASYREIAAGKTLVWLNPESNADKDFSQAVTRWLDELHLHSSDS